jgi:cholesterol transport system auxiliary component
MKMKIWISALLIQGLLACAIQQPPIDSAQWRLMPERAGTAKNTQIPYWLTQGTISVTSPFDSKSFVYRLDDQKYEKDFYNNFITLPSEMVAAATRQWLNQAGIFQFAVGNSNTLMPAYLLQGTVDSMYTDFRAGQKPAAVISIEYYLSSADGKSKNNVLFRKKYQKREPILDNSAKTIANAQQIALAKILAELEEDLFVASKSFPKQ